MSLNSKLGWKWLLTAGLSSLTLLTLSASAEDAGTLYNTPYDVNAGESYFERQCSRCHGFDAKGNDETGAPDITGRLSRASSDPALFNLIREGIAGTAMLPVSASLPDMQVWQLVAYINSLSYDPDLVELDGSADAGVALFTGKGDCDSCHMVDGQGGRLGPDLSRVGERSDPEELMTAMIDPHEDVAPRWWTVRITDSNGNMREGFRMNEDSFSLRIMDNDANLWSFPKSRIQSYERVEESTMPSYQQTMTESEIDDLVAYLFSLRKEI